MHSFIQSFILYFFHFSVFSFFHFPFFHFSFFIFSFKSFCSFIFSFTHSLPVIHLFIPVHLISLIFILSSVVARFISSFSSSAIHTGKPFPIVIFHFRNLRPGVCRALLGMCDPCWQKHISDCDSARLLQTTSACLSHLMHLDASWCVLRLGARFRDVLRVCCFLAPKVGRDLGRDHLRYYMM